METRRIVVPSRRRVHNMERMLKLLPTATICVAKAEKADYAAVVPRKRLLLHDDIPNLIAIRNWLLGKIQEDCVVMIDDDLRGIRRTIGRNTLVTDPAMIAQVIENGHRVAEDLDIGVFCWTRTMNEFLADHECYPFRFTVPMSSSYGFRGRARSRRFDPTMTIREDLDFTLQTLLEERSCSETAAGTSTTGGSSAGVAGTSGS